MKYFYSWGLLFVLPFTIFCYIKATKDVRIKMIVSGIGFGIMSIVFDYMFFDYWHPVYLFPSIHFEDFFYGFLFAGILPGVHNIIRNKQMEGNMKFNIKLAITYILVLLIIFLLIVKVLKYNHIYALCLTPLIVGIISFIKVRGKIIDVLITIVASLFITIFMYKLILLVYPKAIDIHFLLGNISGIKFLSFPLEEWLFAFCLGVGCTYTYEALFNLNK